MGLNEERILDFLDGRLTGGEEEELLHTLAVSPERRGVLKAHMKLREVTSSIASTERVGVPKHVTSQLFTTLEALGLSATASTEDILTRAPQLVKATAEKSVTAILPSLATSGAWHMSFASIVGASLLSFALGAGAYHVFSNGVGVHPMGEAPIAAVQQVTRQQATTSIVQSSVSAVPAAVIDPSSSSEVVRSASEAPLSLSYLTPLPLDRSGFQPIFQKEAPFDGGEPFASVAAREHAIEPDKIDRPTQLASQRILARAIESPVEKPNGTISLRYGMGVMPTNGILSPSSLEEVKFRWMISQYLVGQASLGQLQTSVHEAIPPADRSKAGAISEISTGATTINNFLLGVEGGITLDPLHLPLEATFGVMTDGSNRFYYRGGLFGHYEPVEAMSIAFGLEGIWFNHSIDQSIKNVVNTYRSLLTSDRPAVKGATGSELGGFIGPSIEFGWHF
jgi:hypothetical protein